MRRLRRLVLVTIALALAGYIVWDRVEAYRFSQDVASIAARGEPARYEDAFPQPATAEQREAASLYLQASDAARERAGEDNNRASRLDIDKPGGAEIPLDEIRASYRGDHPAMQLLDRATPLDFGGIPAADREGAYYQYSMSQLGSLACLRADIASATSGSEIAVAALVPCIRLQRVFASSTYRGQHATRILGSLRIFFRHTRPSDEALRNIQQALESWPDDDETRRYIAQYRAGIIDQSGPRFPGIVHMAGRYLFHPFHLRSKRKVLASYDAALEKAALPWQDRWRVIEERRQQSVRRSSAALEYRMQLLDPYSQVIAPMQLIGLGASGLAARRVTAAAIAAERYRRANADVAPGSLGALVPEFLPRIPEDPYSGAPLVLRVDADGYSIYSVDANRRDDGGILYGFGAAQPKHVGPQSPRDLGIRIPLR